MKYKEFDKKPFQAEKREDLIIKSLKNNPKTIKEIMKDTGLLYHHIQSKMILLRTKGIVSKVRFKEFTYFGLEKDYR